MAKIVEQVDGNSSSSLGCNKDWALAPDTKGPRAEGLRSVRTHIKEGQGKNNNRISPEYKDQKRTNADLKPILRNVKPKENITIKEFLEIDKFPDPLECRPVSTTNKPNKDSMGKRPSEIEHVNKSTEPAQ